MPTAAHPEIRPYRDSDHAAIYDICVRTADAGRDATGIYSSDDLMPDLFAGPYVYLQPHLAFVLDDASQAVGYVIGTSDTPRFVADYRAKWIPLLTDRYAQPVGEPVTPDDEMIALHYWPERMLVPEVAEYPAHVHIDLLPPYQGRGYGRALMNCMFDALAADGAAAVHLSMLTENTAARAFYDRLGFHVIDVPEAGDLTYLGRSTSL
ncbi:MAG: GNAT family N-acetyltransferase [Acidothermaceae bacterium]